MSRNMAPYPARHNFCVITCEKKGFSLEIACRGVLGKDQNQGAAGLVAGRGCEPVVRAKNPCNGRVAGLAAAGHGAMRGWGEYQSSSPWRKCDGLAGLGLRCGGEAESLALCGQGRCMDGRRAVAVAVRLGVLVRRCAGCCEAGGMWRCRDARRCGQRHGVAAVHGLEPCFLRGATRAVVPKAVPGLGGLEACTAGVLCEWAMLFARVRWGTRVPA